MSKSTEPADETFARSSFCWAKDLAPHRSQFVSFEFRFSLKETVSAVLHVFADTRYRLFVNGKFLAYGPGRFVTAHPEYDTHRLGTHLPPGGNVIRVEVNYYGCSSYQTMQDGRPGFIAAGGTEGGDIDFATPGPWLATIHRAWDPDSPFFSFAQNPVEICDTRILQSELSKPASHPVSVLPDESTPWSKPLPRSAPSPDYKLIHPARVMASGPIADSLRWGIQLHRTQPVANGREFVSFVTWIHSPQAQIVVLDIFWTEAQLNGEPIAIRYSGRLGNHGESLVELRKGWNFMGGNYEIFSEQWSFLLGLPREAGATLHARPDLDCNEFIAYSGPLSHRVIPPDPVSAETYRQPLDWIDGVSDLDRLTPARITAWDTPDKRQVVRDEPFTKLPERRTHIAKTAMWSFDFMDEYYGQPYVDVEAPPGSVLDIAYDDWKRADGCLDLYHSNPFTESADRFRLAGGRQRIEVLNPRGGIYLQLVLRAPIESGPVPLTIHDVGVRRRTLYNVCEGAFKCGDPVLDWAWQAGVHTLRASTDEAYSDCPWRERGSYIADCLVDLHLNRLLSADMSTARRTFHTFGLAQLPVGLLPGCAPSWGMGPSEDFTLCWVKGVHDIWAHTGDMEFAAKEWPVLKRIFESSYWKAGVDGLWDTTGLFIDWGATESERVGTGNSTLNMARVAALRDSAEMASALGHLSEALRYSEEAESTVAALNAHLWNEREGRFDASMSSASTALHANILALRYGIGPADRILRYLEPLLKENFKIGVSSVVSKGYAELYFFFYLLPALAANDRADLAEALIQEHYGFLMHLGYPTLPETFSQADHGSGSCCHSWSGSPAIYAIEYVLGLRLTAVGEPDGYTLAPVDTGRDRAEGTLPHRLGPINIGWSRRNGRIVAKARAPKGVTITSGSNVDLTLS